MDSNLTFKKCYRADEVKEASTNDNEGTGCLVFRLFEWTASLLVLSVPIKHGYYMKTNKIR